MKAFVIRIKDDELSEQAAKRLVQSCSDKHIDFVMYDAITPNVVDLLMSNSQIKWNYPWEGVVNDIQTGLIKRAYPTADPKKRIACFLSHWKLWNACVAYDEPIIIHEHDAIYGEGAKLPVKDFRKSHFDIIGFNGPANATRLALNYDAEVQKQPGEIVRAPKIDDDRVPQGIAGNSSYYIKPSGAKKLIELVKEYGAWPNDAIMCRQLISTLGQTKKYYTTVQKLPSTTSL